MAIASLVMGIIGFTCAGLLVGAMTGLVLGIVAVRKARKSPAEYGGKELAIAGIVTNSLCLLTIPLVAAIAIPNMIKARQAAHEAAAIGQVRGIAKAQLSIP
jgi:hypothetical protein